MHSVNFKLYKLVRITSKEFYSIVYICYLVIVDLWNIEQNILVNCKVLRFTP